jgi:hypothetical protein
MPRSHYLIPTLLLFITALPAYAESFGVYSGLSQINHKYLTDNLESQEQAYGATLDMQAYRKKPLGWLARGVKARIQQSPSQLDLDLHTPVYQFHTHQGVWLQLQWQQDSISTVLSDNKIYIDDSGNVQPLSSGDTLLLERTFLRGQAYWYESVKDEGPINIVGLYYSIETSPASATLSTTNADVFDGRFSGFGFSLGRIKDDRGLNFQWRLNLAQLGTSFSNDATNHQSASSQESTVYHVDLNLDWHYRYYLAPYWYLVPSIHYQYQSIFQTQLKPEYVEHEQFSFTQFSGFIALRRYF